MKTNITQAQSASKQFKNTRLQSIDALRGFDMFWIMGAGSVIAKIAGIKITPFWNAIALQFQHPYWDGFTFWDMIFPLFMFLSGISSVYSISNQLNNGYTKNKIVWRIIKRGAILILLGIIDNAGGLVLKPLSEYRYPSVLGKIGISYIFASLIYLYSKTRTQIIWYWSLLVGYWLLLKFTSAPGFPVGDLTEKGNFMSYFDRTVLPGKLSRGIHDTVGLLCSITGVATTLLGVLTGQFLKNHPMNPAKKSLWFLVVGASLIVIALTWNLDFPINKNLWSSSYTLLTGGISLILLSIFYYVIDVKEYRRWTFFFRVIGMNSIFIYISPLVIDYMFAAKGLFSWAGQLAGEPYSEVVMGICKIFTAWLVLYFLYKKNVFVRI